jgi:mannose-1-phosphate guanylyltransferase
MQAMILAAGLGTRLLPHTNFCPKPLFPILNRPLLLLTIERLKNFGFDHIIVNCHHLRAQIVDALLGVEGVILQEEETILGTGGGLRKALKVMKNEPLLVTNGDIYHTVNLFDLYTQHLHNSSSVTLAMHDYPRFNNVVVSENYVESFDSTGDGESLAFTGLHVIEPASLEGIEEEGFSCIIDHYKKLLQKGEKIECSRVDGSFWTDMGTEADYLNLHGGLLKGELPCWAEIGPVRKPFCISSRAKLPPQVELDDWACIGDAHIENGSRLKRVVAWDDVFISCGQTLVDKLVSEDYKGEKDF